MVGKSVLRLNKRNRSYKESEEKEHSLVATEQKLETSADSGKNTQEETWERARR